MPNKYILTKKHPELGERKFVAEGMKSAVNQKTKNEDNNSHKFTSVHCQLRKKKKPTLLSLSTKTVLRRRDIEQCRISQNSLVDRALLFGISIRIMKV